METLITIKPLDLEQLGEIRKDTKNIPSTIRRCQIERSIADIFVNFNDSKKGVISSEMLYAIKPELTKEFSEYHEDMNSIIKKLAKSNSILSEQYGYENLAVKPETFKKVIDKEFGVFENTVNKLQTRIDEQEKVIVEQQEKIEELKRKEKAITSVMNDINKEYEEPVTRKIA